MFVAWLQHTACLFGWQLTPLLVWAFWFHVTSHFLEIFLWLLHTFPSVLISKSHFDAPKTGDRCHFRPTFPIITDNHPQGWISIDISNHELLIPNRRSSPKMNPSHDPDYILQSKISLAKFGLRQHDCREIGIKALRNGLDRFGQQTLRSDQPKKRANSETWLRLWHIWTSNWSNHQTTTRNRNLTWWLVKSCNWWFMVIVNFTNGNFIHLSHYLEVP